MTTLPPGIPFSHDAPVNSVKRVPVAGPVEILQRKVQMKSGRAGFEALQQWMCKTAHEELTTQMGVHGNEGVSPGGNERREV
jgi:hypothetical protein